MTPYGGGQEQPAEAVPDAAPTIRALVGTARLPLARLAQLTALGTPGVLDVDAGPDGRFATVDRREHLAGVTCIATRDGGYEVSLRLVCGLVPLRPLADTVRTRVASAAVSAGLPLDGINVEIAGVRDPHFDAGPAAAVPASGQVD